MDRPRSPTVVTADVCVVGVGIVGSSLSSTTGWRVLEDARIAALDQPTTIRFSRYPELTALSEMSRQGLIERIGSGWLLRGDPPGELLQLQPVHVARDDA